MKIDDASMCDWVGKAIIFIVTEQSICYGVGR
jgi:hypothetical protein